MGQETALVHRNLCVWMFGSVSQAELNPLGSVQRPETSVAHP